MAEIKKYLDNVALAALVENIKAEDAKVLTSAQGYADGLAKNYDASGSAAQALVDAKAYADGLASNYDEAGAAATVQGKLDAEVLRAKAAEEANAAAAKKAQDEVDALETYVGTIPADAGVASVVAYVDKKTSGIATDAALTELQGKVTQAEADIDAIEKDYLKAADKTELSGLIADEAARADAAEKANAAAIKVVADDYLKAADKTELEGKITAEANAREAADTALDERLVEVEAFFKLTGEEKLDTALDTLVEIQTYITGEGAAADQMVLDIAANAKAISDEVARATKAEEDIVAAYEAADEALDGRIDALEAKFEGDDSVADQIATAVAAEKKAREAADTQLGKDITAAQEAAEDYADGLNTAMNTRVEALEAIDHEHSNKALLDTYTQTEANLADAVAKKHEHTNKAVLDGITAELVTAWNAAEQNAKTYADGLNTAMTTKVDGVTQRVGALETASATHALKSDLEAAVARITKNEGDIAANASAIGSFTAITEGEVDALFA